MREVGAHWMREGVAPAVGFVREDWYGALHRREPVLAALAFLMLAAIAPTLLAMAFDERTFNGINVWIKPFKFELSSALHLATLALFWPYMDARFRRGRGMRAAVWVVAAVFVFEVGYIAYRASLAEASHFNNSTPQAIFLYAAMGIAIGLVMAITLWVGIQILRSREGDISPTLRLAIGVGLILESVLASVSGGWVCKRCDRLSPRRNSIAMYGVPASSANSKIVTMLRCCSRADARASRKKRDRADSSAEKSPAITLMATSRSSTGSRPR